MTKEELLAELEHKISTGEIRREEVLVRVTPGQGEILPPDSPSSLTASVFSHFSATKILYVLGAAIVVIGIIIFVAQIWDDIGSLARIMVTLGTGLMFALLGSLLYVQQPMTAVGGVFHFIGGLLIPGGALVTLEELGTNSYSIWPVAITFGVIAVFYGLLTVAHRLAVPSFFAIANGTAFVYLAVAAMLDDAGVYAADDVFAYLTMAVGIGYFSLARAARRGFAAPLVGPLYFFGSAAFFGAAFSRVFNSIGWELLFILLVTGGFYTAVYAKSRAILIVSTVALIAHVAYITGEYFSDSLGWPISLVMLGLVFIGLGYASVTINKKYIAG